MSTVDRYRPREGYQPPSLPQKPPGMERLSSSPTRRREIPPAVPSPPSTSRTSPPRPVSRRSAPSPALSSFQGSFQPRRSQWFFTPDEVASTPSVIDGLSPAEERLRRAKGVNFIYQAGILLDLPQITLWVAGVFFHRFYMRYSMVEEKSGIHHYNIAATALFLANKTEENCRKTKDLIIAVAKVAQKNAKLVIDEQSKEYWRWRDSILTYEELMLETLTFDLMVDNPYHRLYEILRQLGLAHNKRIREAAWAFCNDSCLTVLPLLMEARDLSIASILFAASVTHEKIEDIGNEPWWKHLRADEELTIKAVDTMVEFYAENPLRKQISTQPSSPVYNLESTRRSRDETPNVGDAGLTQNGTPTRQQSPGVMNGKIEHTSDVAYREAFRTKTNSYEKFRAETDATRGDSDSALKVAANDLSVHEGRPDSGDLRSSEQLKRRDHEHGLDQSERQLKRPRTEDFDEGEVS
ncbi:hypothetical protein VTK73DRAFT_9497 [Phialemonium thermophilum]|uniref:RNA polymerase II holoenzyme cyclin-like subunit n=1 Tax=Phialemonium thermophilum TaxID=223376 RepID=A0ABR3Y5B6_9PEZI